MYKTAHIFPAFVSDYTGKEVTSLAKYYNLFSEHLMVASKELKSNLTDFDVNVNNFTDNELKTQIIQYVFGCTISDILHENNIFPECISGYSMGIYAALYHAKSIDFETGLKLIKNAFLIIKSNIPAFKYGMASIGGLELKDIKCILINNSFNAEVINVNNSTSFVISGMRNDVENIVNIAKEEGALQAKVFNTSIPYHSTFLNEAANEFNIYINGLNIQQPKFKLVSSIDQRLVESKTEVLKELTDNINKRLN